MKEGHFYLMMHVSDTQFRTSQDTIMEPAAPNYFMGYAFQSAAMNLLYAPSQRYDSTQLGFVIPDNGYLKGSVERKCYFFCSFDLSCFILEKK